MKKVFVLAIAVGCLLGGFVGGFFTGNHVQFVELRNFDNSSAGVHLVYTDKYYNHMIHSRLVGEVVDMSLLDGPVVSQTSGWSNGKQQAYEEVISFLGSFGNPEVRVFPKTK